MASKVIRRSKSDPNYLARQKVTSMADGRLFMKRGDSDEECLIGREQGRFRKKNRPKDGVKRGLRISKAYMLNEDSSAAATDRPTDKPSRIQDFNRRHTVGGSLTTVHEEVLEEREDQEKKWKRDVLIGYLENKYKDYYHSTGNMDQYVEQAGINGYAETDLDDTMSEIDTAPTSGFKRGGHARASLPVVRHGLNKSKDKPLGLIYLQYMNETKRALMPNEVTGMDTVRALFVRSFKGQLNMDMLDLPARKIYIRDPLTEIFYELENPHEIKDRTVLKIYEPGFQESTDAGIIRSSASTPVDTSYLLEPEVDQQVRQRRYHTMTMPVVKEREGRERTKSEGAVYSKQTAQNEGAPDRRLAGALEQRQPPPHQQHPRSQQQHPPSSQNQPQYFQRGAPERATVGGTIPHRPSQNQAPFRRGTPSRASATIPRGDPRGGMCLPSNQQGYRPQERRDWKAPMQGQNRIGGPGGTKGPINSGAKTLPPGASLEGPREPHPQRMGVPRGGPPQGVPPAMHGPPDDGRRSTQSLQGPRASPSPQSYSTSPRRVPPQQNGTIQVTGHKSQPDLRTTHNSSPSAIHQAKGTQDDTSKRIASMEAQIANLAGMVRTAIHHGGGTQSTGGSPVRTNPQMNNGPAQPPHLQRGPNQRQQPGPGHPSHGWGKRGPGSSPMHGRGGYHSAQNSPLMIRQQNNPPPTQQNQQQDNQPETQDGSPKLNLIPARVEFIPPTGEPTTPNLGYIKTTDDSKTTNQPDWQPTNQSGSQTLPQTPTKRSGAPMQSRSSFDQHIRKLRDEQKNIRNMHLHMVKHMNESFQSTSNRIRQALDSRAGVHDPQPIKYQGYHIRQEVARYNHKKDAISNELRQLETRVEKLRVSTVNSRSQVDTRSVDNLAQLLGNSSRLIAEQKATFPLLAGKLKSIMEGEMEVVVVEEKFLKNEPGSLDEYVKRCKKLTGTLYTLKRLAEVQEIQGSKSDLTSELQMSIRNQSPLQQSPAPSPIMSKNPKQTTQTNVQDPSQAPPMKKWFASPAQRSRFEQSLRDCKKNLGTTLFAQNAAMRQKRHITALYQQDQHDTMTPIITPDKEARKSLTKKKGPPPPPPPRRSSSNKASPIKQDRQAMQTSIMGRQEVQPMNGTVFVPDIVNGAAPVGRRGGGSGHQSHGLNFIPPHPHESPTSPPRTHPVLSKSCDDNLHAFHHQGAVDVTASHAGPQTGYNHQLHAQTMRNNRIHQHGFRVIQNGSSEPDVSSHRPPKPPRGQVLDSDPIPQGTDQGESAFKVVAPRPRMVPAQSRICQPMSRTMTSHHGIRNSTQSGIRQPAPRKIAAHHGIRNTIHHSTRSGSGIPITASKRGNVPMPQRAPLNRPQLPYARNAEPMQSPQSLGNPNVTKCGIPKMVNDQQQKGNICQNPATSLNPTIALYDGNDPAGGVESNKVTTTKSNGRENHSLTPLEITDMNSPNSGVIPDEAVIDQIIPGEVKRHDHRREECDQKTLHLKEQYARLRELQKSSTDRSDTKEDAPAPKGTNGEEKPGRIDDGSALDQSEILTASTLGAFPNEILIQGKSNLRNVDEKHGNSIDQALDDLESFALKAGDLDAFSKTGSHRILVESPPARTNRTVHSEAPVMISQSQEPVRERSLSDGDITLDAALNKLISNNNVGETQVPRSPETKSPSRSNKMLESIKQDLKGDEDADFETTRAKEIIQSEEVLSERVVIKEHPEAKGSTWASSSNKNNNSKGQPKIEVGSVLEGRNLSLAGGDQVKKVCPQQITIISPRGKIEETFIF